MDTRESENVQYQDGVVRHLIRSHRYDYMLTDERGLYESALYNAKFSRKFHRALHAMPQPNSPFHTHPFPIEAQDDSSSS